jgi:hypothetical protein
MCCDQDDLTKIESDYPDAMRRIPIEIDNDTGQSTAMNGRNGPPRSIAQFSFVASGSAPTDRKKRTSEHHDRALADAIAAPRKTSGFELF